MSYPLAELRDAVHRGSPATSVSAFATHASRGRWQRYAHTDVIERAVMDTIARGRSTGRMAGLVLSASVRHGKSELVSHWLPAWFLGTNRHARVILAGHEADFAARWGRAARDALTEYGPDVFDVRVSRRSEAANRWDLERPHTGGMLTVGVGGSPIGRGADLLLVDDPVKDYASAMSPLHRQRVREWWAGTMVSRLEPGGAAIVTMARWHEDDLAGWLLAEHGDDWVELRLPALCDDPDSDPLGREMGEPLWPERWDRVELDARRQATTLALGEVVWLAQYQQTPTTPEGGMFPEARWRFVSPGEVPAGLRWVRGWDLAASEGSGDWTVGARLARLPDGRWLVDGVVRGRWEGNVVRDLIVATAAADPAGTIIELPQDPGQAGKDQAQQLVRSLAGYPVHARPQTGSKEVRAAGWAAQVQAGNAVLVDGPWNGPFVAEHAGFPRGVHDDQVDAAATAFNRAAGHPSGPTRAHSVAGRRTAGGSSLAAGRGRRIVR